MPPLAVVPWVPVPEYWQLLDVLVKVMRVLERARKVRHNGVAIVVVVVLAVGNEIRRRAHANHGGEVP